jgi:hypothetical protein
VAGEAPFDDAHPGSDPFVGGVNPACGDVGIGDNLLGLPAA